MSITLQRRIQAAATLYRFWQRMKKNNPLLTNQPRDFQITPTPFCLLPNTKQQFVSIPLLNHSFLQNYKIIHAPPSKKLCIKDASDWEGEGWAPMLPSLFVLKMSLVSFYFGWVGESKGRGVASTLQVSLLFLTYHEILTSERWSRVQNNIYTYLNINQKKTKSATICYWDKPTPCGDCWVKNSVKRHLS